MMIYRRIYQLSLIFGIGSRRASERSRPPHPRKSIREKRRSSSHRATSPTQDVNLTNCVFPQTPNMTINPSENSPNDNSVYFLPRSSFKVTISFITSLSSVESLSKQK